MTTKWRIYHNPRCSKSRQTLQLLQEHGIDCEVVEYLKTPPSTREIETILSALQLAPRELMRRNEAEYKENSLDQANLSHQQLVQAIHDYPKLLQRPIVTKGKKAAIGRPPENILEIIG